MRGRNFYSHEKTELVSAVFFLIFFYFYLFIFFFWLHYVTFFSKVVSIFNLKYHLHIETWVGSQQEIKPSQYKSIPVTEPILSNYLNSLNLPYMHSPKTL